METRRISRRKPTRQLARGRSCETSRPFTLVHRVHLPSSFCCTASCSSLSLSPTCRCSSGLRRDGNWHSTIKHWLLQRGVRVALRLHLQRHIRRVKKSSRAATVFAHSREEKALPRPRDTNKIPNTLAPNIDNNLLLFRRLQSESQTTP